MTVISMYEKCHGCGGQFERIDGPIHNYMLSSAGCWKRYGEVLAREYEDPALFATAHRLTVDAFALQHPGLADDKRAYQSVRLHYVSLFLIFEVGWTQRNATKALQTLAGRVFEPLPDPPNSFEITVADVWQANVEDHVAMVRQWAECAYTSWSLLDPFAEEMVTQLTR